MQTPPIEPEPSSSRLRQFWGIVKWVLFAALIAAVSYRGWVLWNDVDSSDVHLHAGWLTVAVVLYIAAWIPALTYWRWLLAAVGDDIPRFQVARAYYCGHLGKYVPGKAGVIVIRAAMIAGAGGTFVRGALTAGYESLTTIGAGTAMAAMFAPWMFPDLPDRPDWQWLTTTPGYPYFVPVLVIAGCLAALPLTARLFALLARKSSGAPAAADAQTLSIDNTASPKGISTQLLLLGSATVMLGWCVHGLVLGCIIRGSGTGEFNLADWPLWTATIAAAVSVGFVAIFAPAGIGVRELILVEALKHHIGPQHAVAVAVLLRLVSLVGELVAAAGLWPFGPKQKMGAKP